MGMFDMPPSGQSPNYLQRAADMLMGNGPIQTSTGINIAPQDIDSAMNLAMAFSGGGLSTVRAYQNVPDALMGFRKTGAQKGFSESQYPHTQNVEVTLPASQYAPQETFVDQIKGMNPDHAFERAWRNWPNALHITPLNQ